MRRAICLCSRSTSRWDSRSNRSKSRICSHWGPSWGWGDQEPSQSQPVPGPRSPPASPALYSTGSDRLRGKVRILPCIYGWSYKHEYAATCLPWPMGRHSQQLVHWALTVCLHCAKFLVNNPSHKCELCVDSYRQIHWHTASSLEQECPGLGRMNDSTHFDSGAFSPLPPGPLPGEPTPEQAPPLRFICISLTSGPHPTLQADILV